MAKKNHKKNGAMNLTRAGSTFAVAMAVTMALSNQAYAAEVTDVPVNEPVNPVNETPAPAAETSTPAVVPVAPAEVPAANAEITQSNADTGSSNSAAAESNQEQVADNSGAAADNSANTGGKLAAPEMPDLPDAPTAPEAPGTEGTTEEKNEAVEDYNNQVGDYNDQVDDYNGKVDEYNGQVDQYNQDADAYDAAAQQKYEDYQKEQSAYDQAYQDYLKECEKLEQEHNEKEAQAAIDHANKELAEYEEAKNKAETEHNQKEAQAAIDHANKELAEYEEAKNKAETEHNQKEAQAAIDHANKELAEYEEAKNKAETEHNQKEAQAAIDHANKELAEYEADKKDAQDKYNEDKQAYDDAVAEEKKIYVEVTDYNTGIQEENEKLEDANDALVNDLNTKDVENIDGVGEHNENIVVDQETTDALNSYGDLASRHQSLLDRGAALDADTRKDMDLGSAEYNAYLEDIKQYNQDVSDFNALVTAYNEAVAKYNSKVDEYNATVKDQENSSASSSTENGASYWGNINIENVKFSHIDVKYTAAIGQDTKVTVDDQGNETITGSSHMTQYTVTGVYTGEEAAAVHAAAKENPRYNESKDGIKYYGINYKNNANSNYEVHNVKLDTANNEFGNPNHTGAALDPAQGQINFYVTLEDEDGNTQGLNITMDATTVYPEGTYYKAESNDFLDRFVGKNGETLQQVEINGEMYYDISGQSVFVVSALTCDGMQENGTYKNYWTFVSDGTLNTNGLDLVLNLRTLVEIHQSGKADKLTYMTYDLGKTAQAEKVERETYEQVHGKFDYPEFKGTPYSPNEFKYPEFKGTPYSPNEFKYPEFKGTPYSPNEFKYPEFKGTPYSPNDFVAPEYKGPSDPDDMDAPVETERLTHIDKLDKLDELLYYVDPAPVDPAPVDPTPVNPTPVNPTPVNPTPVNPTSVDFVSENEGTVTLKKTVKIVDEKIPLAKAPQTGDLSGIWAVISGLSLGGISLLNKKRKDEE